MKTFFSFALLALVGAALFYFVLQKNTVDDLLALVNGGKETPAPKVASSPSPASKTTSKPAVKKAKSEIDQLVEKQYPMPMIRPLVEITKNWSEVPANAYPKQILATEAVPFTLMINGQAAGSSNVAAGTAMKPVRLTGDQLTVASLANSALRSRVHVDKTNFKLLIEKRYNDFVTKKKNEVASLRAKAKKALLAKPDRLASLKDKGGSGDPNDPRFDIVKTSIKRGDVPASKLEDVKSFKWNGTEALGGDMRGTFDTVSVQFEVSTIFGKFASDYKCLIKGGRVVGWIDPITQEKI